MLDIRYEDEHILVLVKPAGIESQESRGLSRDMVSEIKKHLKKNGSQSLYVGVIHRLDKPVSGLMVYAKTPKAAAALSKQVQASGHMHKEYTAAVLGNANPFDSLSDYMVFDKVLNISSISSPTETGSKLAELSYKLISNMSYDEWLSSSSDPFDKCKQSLTRASFTTNEPVSIITIKLKTGRHHQIRLQLSSCNLPIIGDAKYNPLFINNPVKDALCLCASGLEFCHPITGKRLTFNL